MKKHFVFSSFGDGATWHHSATLVFGHFLKQQKRQKYRKTCFLNLGQRHMAPRSATTVFRFAENSKKTAKMGRPLFFQILGRRPWQRVQVKTCLGAGLSGTSQLPDERALGLGSVVCQLSVVVFLLTPVSKTLVALQRLLTITQRSIRGLVGR